MEGEEMGTEGGGLMGGSAGRSWTGGLPARFSATLTLAQALHVCSVD